ncbi:MAG TPA: hypothetical protein VH762_18180 [Gemmatimonadaceae bacterium]
MTVGQLSARAETIAKVQAIDRRMAELGALKGALSSARHVAMTVPVRPRPPAASKRLNQ